MSNVFDRNSTTDEVVNGINVTKAPREINFHGLLKEIVARSPFVRCYGQKTKNEFGEFRPDIIRQVEICWKSQLVIVVPGLLERLEIFA